MIYIIFITLFVQLGLVHSADGYERIAVLGPATAQTLIDIGLGDKIACAAEPFERLKLKKDVQSLGFYHNPSIELVISCKPDLVIATYAGTQPRVYKKLEKLGYNVILEKPDSLTAIKQFIIDISKKFERPRPKILKKFDTVCKDKKQKSAVMLVGLNPSICAGKKTFVSSALECAGFNNPIKGMYPRTSPERLIKINPDLVFIAFKDPYKIKDYKVLKAVFKERLIVINPDNILEPSTRIIKGIQELVSFSDK